MFNEDLTTPKLDEINIDIPYPEDTHSSNIKHILEPVSISYLDFHNLFFYDNKQFTPNTKMLTDLNLKEYILNQNRLISQKNENLKIYNLFNVLKKDYNIVDIQDKIAFTKQMNKNNIKTLFDCDDICKKPYTFTLDDLFNKLNTGGFLIDEKTGMPQQDIWLTKSPIVNIMTRFKRETSKRETTIVDVVWPFKIDFTPQYGLACWFEKDRYRNFYITLEEFVYHAHKTQ
jgi:hypothetical protein